MASIKIISTPIVMLLLIVKVMAQPAYKTEFEKIKKTYESIGSYEVPITISMYDLKTSRLLEQSAGKYMLAGKNRYYKSTAVESITYDGVAIDVYHNDKTLIVSKPKDEKTNLNPTSYILDQYLKVTGGGTTNKTRTYTLNFPATGIYTRVDISYNTATYFIESIKIFESSGTKDEPTERPIIIEIKYGKLLQKALQKADFPIEKFITKTQTGFKCQPAYSAYQLMNTYSN